MNALDLSPEEAFRYYHEDAKERKVACCNSMDDDPCPNSCRYLISGDLDGHLPSIEPLDGGKISDLYWGGDDIEDVTVYAYCRECAEACDRWEREEKARQGAEHRARREMEDRQHAVAAKVRHELREFWIQLSDLGFERECSTLFTRLGFSSRTTAISSDGAFDILLEKDGRRGAAQCKAWAQPVGVKALREFYGALRAEGFVFGYFIARGDVTESARRLLSKMPELECWNLEALIDRATQCANDAANLSHA